MQSVEHRILLGNEAISRGLIEGGCQFITAYPGTPSSEILPAVVQFKEELGLTTYAEWSTNEKVALETALAAAYSGKRTAVAMKQVGLNVAADPALSSAYIGVVGGLVLVVADDPGPQSSQTEQDSRLFALFAKIPALDPSSPQEAKDLAALAFELSERHQIPVMLRPTVRICHAKQSVACGSVDAAVRPARFEKNPRRWAATPKARYQLHLQLNQKLAAIEKEFETWEGNRAIFPDGLGDRPAPLGIVASGVSYAYLADLLEPLDLGSRVAVLKLATAFPLPRTLVEDFAGRCERLLVLEETDIAVETQIRVGKAVWGRLSGHVPPQGELTPEVLEQVVTQAAREAGLEPKSRHLGALRAAVGSLELPIRRPTLCPGCGHRAAFYALRRSFPDGLFPGDIGCYTLGLNLGGVDTVHDMGASISMAAGFFHAYNQDGQTPPIFATIGDGTFFHSGAAGLASAVYNGARFVLVVLDNETTGMTGMQPTPEFGTTADGHPGRTVSLEALIRGCGVEHLTTGNPYDLPRFQRLLSDALDHTRSRHGGVAVIVARYACVTQVKGLGPYVKPTPVEVRYGPVPRAEGVTAALDPTWMPRHEDKVSPCCEACPAGNDIERVMALAGEGRFEEAARALYEEHPFPSILGRVCPHPCEPACNRAGYDGAVSVRSLERAAGDAAHSAALTAVPPPALGRSVAVVGGGPAGLTAAYHLARLGYTVDLLEARPEVGGMLRWAIPEYRLPASVLDRELAVFAALGVRIHAGRRVGSDLPWSELDRFDAVFVATGAWRERSLGIDGEDREGVFKGLDFLGRVRGGAPPSVGRRVAVLGGGNTALDAARAARRLGAEVTVYYRRSAAEIRAIPEEVTAARAEGVFFRFHVVPVLVAAGRARRLSLRLREADQREPEAFAVRPPAGEAASEFWTEVDTVVVAVGADPDVGFLDGGGLCEEGRIRVDAWGRTRLPRLFAGGDASTRASGTVAGAVNAGKRAALAIHAALSHEPLAEGALRLCRGPGIAAEVAHRGGQSTRAARVQAVPPLRTINLRHFPEAARAEARQRRPEEAIWGFEEADLGLPPERAVEEARERCFHCGVCTECDTCLKVCPSGAISRGDGGYRVDPQKCTGCRLCQVECPRSAITMPAVGSCIGCGYCVTWLECPSLVRRADGLVEIDRRTCVDCGLCAQVCCQGAIQPREAAR